MFCTHIQKKNILIAKRCRGEYNLFIYTSLSCYHAVYDRFLILKEVYLDEYAQKGESDGTPKAKAN